MAKQKVSVLLDAKLGAVGLRSATSAGATVRTIAPASIGASAAVLEIGIPAVRQGRDGRRIGAAFSHGFRKIWPHTNNWRDLVCAHCWGSFPHQYSGRWWTNRRRRVCVCELIGGENDVRSLLVGSTPIRE